MRGLERGWWGRIAAALLLVAAAASAGEAGGEPGELDLEEAIRVALGNNNLLLAADAGLRGAEAAVEEARSHWMPRVEVQEVVSRTTNPVHVFGGLLGQESFTAEHFDPAFLNEPDALDNWHTRLQVTQPIWTGGHVSHAVGAADRLREAAVWGRDRTRQEVVHQVVEAYTGAVLAAAQREVAREALETSHAHVRLVRDLWESGLVVRSDLLEAEVRMSEVQEMLIVANSAEEVARAALNVAMGLEPEGPFPPLLGIESAPEEEGDLATLTSEAREARPDLRAAAAGVEAAERAELLARSGRRPEVGFVGALEANDPDFAGTEGTNWSLAVAARFNVFDGFESRSRVQRAREERVRAERMRDLLEQQVALDVRRAYYDLRAARQRLEQARRAVERAAEGLRIVQDRYREGLATWVEVREAETSRTRSRSREISAARDLLLGSYALRLAVGRL